MECEDCDGISLAGEIALCARMVQPPLFLSQRGRPTCVARSCDAIVSPQFFESLGSAGREASRIQVPEGSSSRGSDGLLGCVRQGLIPAVTLGLGQSSHTAPSSLSRVSSPLSSRGLYGLSLLFLVRRSFSPPPCPYSLRVRGLRTYDCPTRLPTGYQRGKRRQSPRV